MCFNLSWDRRPNLWARFWTSTASARLQDYHQRTACVELSPLQKIFLRGIIKLPSLLQRLFSPASLGEDQEDSSHNMHAIRRPTTTNASPERPVTPAPTRPGQAHHDPGLPRPVMPIIVPFCFTMIDWQHLITTGKSITYSVFSLSSVGLAVTKMYKLRKEKSQVSCSKKCCKWWRLEGLQVHGTWDGASPA